MRTFWRRGDRTGLPHRLDELLLAYYAIKIVPRLGFSDEIQTPLRLPPHLVEVISAREKIRDGMVAAVTGENAF